MFHLPTYDEYGRRVLNLKGILDDLTKAIDSGKSPARALKQKESVLASIGTELGYKKGFKGDGITWEEVGCDLLLVDEGQNFKNLYAPKSTFGSAPRYLGAAPASKQARQLDIRSMVVRANVAHRYPNDRGSHIFILSATPAKNSPIEFFNVLQYIDPQIFKKYDISNADDFLEMFLTIESIKVLGASLSIVERAAVVGFKKLDIFREMIQRYSIFKTIDDIRKDYPDLDIKVPDIDDSQILVDMNSQQDEIYDQIIADMKPTIEIIDGKEKDCPPKVNPLEGIMQMSLVTLHPALLNAKFNYGVCSIKIKKGEEVEVCKPLTAPQIKVFLKDNTWKVPKLTACIQQVKKNSTCGNIIFVENILIHYLLKKGLVENGIGANRIAILNGREAKDPLKRQEIAIDFNFPREGKKKPLYDIVIANQIAYEGIDLQARTCAIHHLDLGWEPATLQQRNGRGVRGGNSELVVAIYYYLCKRSIDQYRFLTIYGKRNWLIQAVQSQDRKINNAGAQQDFDPSLVMKLMSRSDEEYEANKAIGKELERQYIIRTKRQEKAAEAQRIATLFESSRMAEKIGKLEVATNILQQANDELEKFKATDATTYPFVVYGDMFKRSKVKALSYPDTVGLILVEGMQYEVYFPPTQKESGSSTFIVLRLLHKSVIIAWLKSPKEIKASNDTSKSLYFVEYPYAYLQRMPDKLKYAGFSNSTYTTTRFKGFTIGLPFFDDWDLDSIHLPGGIFYTESEDGEIPYHRRQGKYLGRKICGNQKGKYVFRRPIL